MVRLFMKKENLRINILKALTDATRLQILQMLKHGEKLCVCEIQEKFNKSQSTISNHLKILVNADILSSWKEGSKTMYQIRDFHIFKILAEVDKMIKNVDKYKEIIKIQEKISV